MTTFHIANHSDAISPVEVGHPSTKSHPMLPRRYAQPIDQSAKTSWPNPKLSGHLKAIVKGASDSFDGACI